MIVHTSEQPSQCVLHVAGIPATGKSSFCRYLARNHGFAHYDLECYPGGWPKPELFSLWQSAPAQFVSKLLKLHAKAVIDWGFPVQCLPTVTAFRAAGARLIWFAGDTAQARRLFVERGGLDPRAFDNQVMKVARSGLPTGLDVTVVDALTHAGQVQPMAELYTQVFKSG